MNDRVGPQELHRSNSMFPALLPWPHSAFHLHTAVWIAEDDRAFAIRLARDCARNPVALKRLTHDRTAKAVT